MTHIDLNIIYHRCSELRRLNLSCCYSLNDLNFRELGQALHRLEYLNLSYVIVDFDDALITDAPLLHLRELLLVAIPGFRNNYLAFCLQLPALTLLDVSGNFELTNAAFIDEDSDDRASWLQRRQHPLKIKIGGTEICLAVLDAHPELPIEFSTFDSSITSFRQDQRAIDYINLVSDDDDSDYDDDDSFGAGGDLDDLDYLDPVEEFERDWMS